MKKIDWLETATDIVLVFGILLVSYLIFTGAAACTP